MIAGEFLNNEGNPTYPTVCDLIERTDKFKCLLDTNNGKRSILYFS